MVGRRIDEDAVCAFVVMRKRWHLSSSTSEDVFMIAMQSDTLFHAAQTLACYTVKRIGSFVKNVSDPRALSLATVAGKWKKCRR